MKIQKILISCFLIFLLIGIAAATNIDSLIPPEDCGPLKDGVASYDNHIDRMFYIEKASGDYVTDWFTNTTYMTVEDVGDNIYSYADTQLKMYGYQEIVNIDGTDYLISINQGSQLSPGEETNLLKDMQEFNKVNNLDPVEI